MKFKILHIDYNGSIKNRDMFDRLSKDCGVEIAVTNLFLGNIVVKKYLDKFTSDTSFKFKDSEDATSYFMANQDKFDYVYFSLDSLVSLDRDKSDNMFDKKMKLKMDIGLRDAMIVFALIDKNKQR